jgi:hypothetical protein
MSATNDSRMRQREAHRRKREHGTRRSVLSVYPAVRLAGDKPPASRGGLNRAATRGRSGSAIRTDHDGLVREEKPHARGIYSGGRG